ncbi:MAG: MFS transporter [Bacteroidetes bacterium]|jgi:maltose/moltooligosaccharide transporter|nr:MFS transporter [Bacteroidota bacterium]
MEKPRLSFWQIWNMSFGFLGIQFGLGLQNANVSRIFETLGASVDDIPILWVAAPVTGLIVQPIIGHMSDKTWGRYGRRRPYFMIGAILASLALILMPNSPALWVAAGTLWILDASINISMEPFRAFVGDMLPDRQRTQGFAMQSFFIGIGAVIASILPWLLTNVFHVSNVAPENEIPPSLKIAFVIGAVVFFTAILVTVFTTKEYSPEQLQAFEDEKNNAAGADKKQATAHKKVNYYKNGIMWLAGGAIATALVINLKVDKELYIATIGSALFGIILLISGFLRQKDYTRNGFYEIMEDIFHMPKTMKQLAWVQFFSWFALFAMWIYTTSAVTSYHFGALDTTSKMYNDGADWVGILFGTYNGVAAIAAFIIVWIARKTSRKFAHSFSLILGGIGYLSFFFLKDIELPLFGYTFYTHHLLLVSEVGIGFAWASILSMPYAMLTSALPSNKMGIFMGIFNFFLVIPQIIAASILGFLLRTFFDKQAIFALVMGGCALILAAVITQFVHDTDG